MRKAFYGLVMVSLVFIWACGSSENGDSDKIARQNAPREETATKADKAAPKPRVTVTRQDLEQKLKDLGIPVYENAVFDRIKKTKNGTYSILYLLPDTSKQYEKTVNEFYSQLLDKIAAQKGWKRSNAGNLMMFLDANQQLVFSCSNVVTLKGDRHLLEFDTGNAG
ncbi:MAG: hypothetical protein JRJ79_13820 [Deltaproteobacteria bacterium]|nr:hypothetical protein [Deltaproteobacteria bacterium]MBW2342277.1 hypothetical protein [Deltaproteobacteria bacterium]